MCIKTTSEKGKPIKANAESDFSNIRTLFTSAQGSLKKSYKTRGSALFISAFPLVPVALFPQMETADQMRVYSNFFVHTNHSWT